MNLDGPVRVADIAGSGTASITLSFDAWKDGKVASTNHNVVVLAPKAGPKLEAVASNLIATLVHPERKASVWGVKFSPDGKQLFTTGYPSGIIQTWDVASRNEVRRINSPAGNRGSAEYAFLTPDWKTLYVPVERRKVVRGEKDGKAFVRVEQSGEIRIWDMTTGEEKASLKSPSDAAPIHASLSPDGSHLVCVERFSLDTEDRTTKMVTVVWNLKTGERRVLCDGFAGAMFSPDGSAIALKTTDIEAKTSVVKILDAATLREAAKLDSPDKDRHFSVESFSPDGSVLAVNFGGKKGGPREVWFRDAKTLADRGKYVGAADPEGYGFGRGEFTPDGTRYVVVDGTSVRVWDVAAKKVLRSADVGANSWHTALSPDGKTFAVAWSPKSEESSRDPDPADLPQPRVTLLDIAGDKPPRVLVCPHGYVGGLAFSPDGKTLAFGTAGGVHLFDVGK